MRYIFIYIIALFCGVSAITAQDEGFYLQVRSDTILAGNVLEVSFVANNVAGQFEAPDMEGLNVISGPNTSSAISMMNGAVTQKATYSYSIFLEDIGEVIIPPAYFITKEGTLETEPKSLIVLPNPEGIIEHPPSQSGFFQFNFPNNSELKRGSKKDAQPKKKKRKLKRI